MGIGLVGCSWDGYQHATLLGNTSTQVKVLSDSARMAELIVEGEGLSKELKREFTGSSDPAKLLRLNRNLELDNLLQRISGEPGFDIPGTTHLRILRESTCHCTHSAIATLYYLQVEFTEGPSKGKVGWVCRGAIDDPRTRSL